MKSIDSVQALEALVAEGIPVVLKFEAAWCQPCRMMQPALDEIAQDMPHLAFRRVDVDALPQIADRYGVRGVPTCLLLVDGEVRGRLGQAAPKARIKESIRAGLER